MFCGQDRVDPPGLMQKSENGQLHRNITDGHDPGFASATRLELHPSLFERAFTDSDAQRQTDQVGIIEFDPGRFVPVIHQRFNPQ